MRSFTPARARLPGWAEAEGPFGIRLFDVGVSGLVIAAVEINVIVVSPLTAKTHVSRAMTKLNARDRAQLVVFAYEHGLTGS